ncbi:MAG: Cof-type HAD-IIB family hydrolase [Allobaculum sp.]
MKDNKRPITTLVAVDLDGTLLTSEKKVSEETKKAIRKLKEHGIQFGIVSGRPVESGLILCEGWGIQDSISFLIGMNGGVLYDVRRKEKETYSIIPGHLIWKIIEAYKEMPTLHFEVMVGNNRYVQYSTPETLANAELYGEKEIIVDLEEFLEDHNVNKLVIRSTPEEQPRVKEIGASIHLPGVTCFSTSDILFEFVDPDINKGYGLYKVCDHFGLKLENVVAFGDENNDVEMLMTAGTGVAMGNALPSVKAICNVVSEYTNDEDAIAHYINEVILPNQQDKVEK